MFRPVEKPRVAVLGLSLELYQHALPGYMDRLAQQLIRFIEPLKASITPAGIRLCYLAGHVADSVQEAERSGADAVLLVPVSYTASGMALKAVLRTPLPVVVWNTQEAHAIAEDYDFDDLLMNHVTQGTQDLTNALLRNGKVFGMESGHYRDTGAIARLADWLAAARARRFAQNIRVGLLGHPFQDMGDFAIDETRMAGKWGPCVIRLSIPRFAELAAKADRDEVAALMAADRQAFDVLPEVTEAVHLASARLEWAIRKLVEENNLDALTLNFMDLIGDGRCETLPFLGINKLMGGGLGYAGEGDAVTAAHMAQMRQLCGAANFTEIFTVDYAGNRMLMMHMQECNPALTRRDRKVRLVRKDFWAPGVQPYVGMYFTLEPGPVTLTCITSDEQGGLYYIAGEARIVDRQPLAKLDVPHWIVELDEPVGEFLTRYSMAGGPHHLVAVPGHRASMLGKLAHLQGFGFQQL